ncbi:MAG: hypothetical protein I4O48_09160, partial [Ralstonia sp.]|nr:hypothetical protein [Ralstonia sp.]
MYHPSRFARICAAAFALAALVSSPSHAHGIAGNRFFPGTLNFDDPAVADEFSITAGAVQHPDNSRNVTDRGATVSFARLLTPEVSIGFDSGFIRRDWDSARQPGATGSDLILKSRLYEDDLNETLV